MCVCVCVAKCSAEHLAEHLAICAVILMKIRMIIKKYEMFLAQGNVSKLKCIGMGSSHRNVVPASLVKMMDDDKRIHKKNKDFIPI